MVYVTTPFRHLFNRRRKVVETVKPDPLTDLENAIVTTLPTMVFGIVASHFRDVVNTGSINGWTILIVNVGCVTVATYPQMAVGYAAFSIVTKLLQRCAFALPKGRGVGSFCIVGLYVQRVGLNPTPYDIQILLLTTVLSIVGRRLAVGMRPSPTGARHDGDTDRFLKAVVCFSRDLNLGQVSVYNAPDHRSPIVTGSSDDTRETWVDRVMVALIDVHRDVDLGPPPDV